MQKKLTITMDETVYNALHKVIGRRNISRFLTDLARPLVLPDALEKGYKQMAADRVREAEAQDWSESLFGDADHD
jgi:hypothetical protein